MSRHRQRRMRSTFARRGFTLAELLVVMGLIAILATITVVAVGAIADDARLSTGKNTVLATLSNARSLALKNNQLVLVAFRARTTGEQGNEQVVEAVTAIWSGETIIKLDPTCSFVQRVVDRFIPMADVPARDLPRGVKVAAPLFVGGDRTWATSSHLPAIVSSGEAAGVVCAVMYAPDGSVVTQNARSDADRVFVDFAVDRVGVQPVTAQRQGGTAFDYQCPNFPAEDYCHLGDDDQGVEITEFFCQDAEDDEPFLVMAPFLAVFDDVEAREILDPSRWTLGGSLERIEDLTEYINERADRIHFNRYTGVAMK